MKVLAILLAIAALVIAIAPQFSNCEATGDMKAPASSTMATPATVASGMPAATTSTTPVKKMKCYWTARGEVAVAIPLFGAAALLFFARRKEAKRALAIVSMLLGVSTILLTTVLIGACLSDTATCRTTMQPTLLVAGGFVVALSVIALVINERKREE